MQNILIVGTNGSLGNALFHELSKQADYKIFGTTTKSIHQKDTIFHLDFMNDETINSFPKLKLHHVIIAAGYEPSSNLMETNSEHIDKMFRIHVTKPMLFIQQITHQLEDESSITFISSPAAWQGSYDPAYAAAKGAVNSLMRTLAKDLAPKTRVNAFSPSLIESSTVFNGMTDDFKQRHIDKTLNKRLLTLTECVDAMKFILSSKHYTGQILHLNGGMIYG
jgi:3-oxoacyl-[acyl-carrier protein] reductase